MSRDQVIQLYEDGVPIEDLAKEFFVEPEAIKVVLASGSVKYREGIKDKKIFTEDTVEHAKMVMGDLLHAENESVKYRASKFIINESEGRNTVNKTLGQVNLNLTLINQHFQKAREAINRAKQVTTREEAVNI